LTIEELYQQHKDTVYNVALHYVQQVEDAQEITQDVFVAVYQSIDSFQGAATVSTWIYRITVNKCLDFIKAKQRKKRFAFFSSLFKDESVEANYHPPENNHPGIQMEDKEALTILFGHINQLPDNQKTALILHKIEQQSQAEVAEIMGISVKAVESLIQRAKTNLTKKINQTKDTTF
jgi:RNA polymerase sigma factor (sigma-70 family)